MQFSMPTEIKSDQISSGFLSIRCQYAQYIITVPLNAHIFRVSIGSRFRGRGLINIDKPSGQLHLILVAIMGFLSRIRCMLWMVWRVCLGFGFQVEFIGPSWLYGIWLVSYSDWWLTYPSEKYESRLGLLFPIYGKIKHVPNHQPVLVYDWYIHTSMVFHISPHTRNSAFTGKVSPSCKLVIMQSSAPSIMSWVITPWTSSKKILIYLL